MATQIASKQPLALSPISRLAAAKRGRLSVPSRYMVYGVEGVGKSTLLSYAPNPIWFDADDGTAKLEVTRYPFRLTPEGHVTPDGHVPHTYREICDAIDDLTVSPHDFKTLVIDTADRIESMIWRHIIDRDNERVREKMSSIEDYGYGKGYVSAVDEWRSLCARLDRLRAKRGMAIAFLAHSFVRNFKNPEGPDFDRYQLAINDKAAGFLKSWSDVVGFLRFEEGATEEKKSKRARGWSTDVRIMHLTRTAAFDAKGRGGMPPELKIPVENPWSVIAEAEAEADMKGEELVAQINTEVARIGDPALTPRVKASVEEAVSKKDLAALTRYLQALKDKPAVTNVAANT